MRVVLVNTPAALHEPSKIVPTGILNLAAYLRQHGHDVRVIDLAHTRAPFASAVRDASEFDPQLIGVGGLVTAYKYIIELTHELRRALPRVPIVVGGQVVTNNEKNCFEHMAIDYLIKGYGEIPLEKLVRHLSGALDVVDIPGLVFRQGNVIVENPGREFFKQMDDMPLPAYDLVDMTYYTGVLDKGYQPLTAHLERTGKRLNGPVRYLTIMWTLGCTDRCTFCIHEQEFVGLKQYSLEYLRNHIRHIVDRYGVNFVAIGEEMSLTTVPRAKQLCGMLNEHFPELYWAAVTRAVHITPELIDVLKQSNCMRVAFGFESASQKMLDVMMKRVDREQNIRAVQLLGEAGLSQGTPILVGNVGETLSTVRETIAGIHEAKLGLGGVFFVTAFPGGRIWDWALERGIITDTHAYLLRASHTDHVSWINSNLTPYPDFILRCWQALIQWAMTQEEYKKPFGRFARMRRGVRWIAVVRKFLRSSVGLPIPVVAAIATAYDVYYRATRKLYRTRKDRMYEYKTDAKGALLPEKLIVGKPQKHLEPAQLLTLRDAPRVRIPLEVLKS